MRIHRAAECGDIKAVQLELDAGVSVDAVAAVGVDVNRPGSLIFDEGKATFSLPMTPLMVAAHSHRADTDMVQFLLLRGANPNGVATIGGMLFTPLHAAERQLEKTRILLAAGADPCAPRGTRSPLASVSFGGDFDAVRLMIARGADVQMLGWTDLMQAIVAGSVEDVTARLREGAELECRDHVDRTPWILNLCAGDLAKGNALLASGADKNGTGRRGMTGLSSVIRRPQSDERHALLHWLIAIGVDLDAADEFGGTALYEAAALGDTDALTLLLQAGANPGIANQIRTLPINVAANAECIRILVEAGADIDYEDGTGECRLMSAARAGDAELVRFILGLDAGQNSKNRALIAAVKRDHLEIMRILLDAGGDPNSQDGDQWSLLHHAVNVDAARLLLERGADVHAVNDIGHDALRSQRSPEIQALLMQAGASVNASGSSQWSPLFMAARDGDAKRARFLIEHGADVHAATELGQTAVMAAAEIDAVEVVRLLLDAGADPAARDYQGRTALFYAAAPEAFMTYRMAVQMAAGRDGAMERMMNVVPVEARQFLEAGMGNAMRVVNPSFARVKIGAADALRALARSKSTIDLQDNDGRTALSLAASCGHPARVRALLEAGAAPRLPDARNLTPLDYAQSHADPLHRAEIVELLTGF